MRIFHLHGSGSVFRHVADGNHMGRPANSDGEIGLQIGLVETRK